jgi:tellurite resistance protein TerC
MPEGLAVAGFVPWVGLVAALVFLLWVDLHFFARGRDPSFREGVVWSLGWLALSLAVIPVVLVLDGSEAAVNYTTVYFIERSLSLDNLFVFLLLFAYFSVPVAFRARLLFFGIVAALAMRGLAILGGTALIEQFHVVLYVLGVLLIVLAYRILRGVGENVDPDRNLIVRGVRKLFPVTSGFRGRHWFVSEDGRRHVTPLFLCLAAFAITRDSFIIWMGNVFALLGLRALFVLVEGLIRRFRFLDETIAVVLALVGVKLLIEDLVHIGPVVSLLIVLGAFAIGMIASVVADRRDPEGKAERLAGSKQPEEAARRAREAAGDPLPAAPPERFERPSNVP